MGDLVNNDAWGCLNILCTSFLWLIKPGLHLWMRYRTKSQCTDRYLGEESDANSEDEIEECDLKIETEQSSPQSRVDDDEGTDETFYMSQMERGQ